MEDDIICVVRFMEYIGKRKHVERTLNGGYVPLLGSRVMSNGLHVRSEVLSVRTLDKGVYNREFWGKDTENVSDR